MLRSQWNRWLNKSTKKQPIRKAERLGMLQLEDRVTPAMLYVNDNWHLLTDNGTIGILDAGDVINNSNDGGSSSFTIGTDLVFGTVTTGSVTGGLPGGTTIQSAINASSAGDTVNILQGIYTGDFNVNKSITIMGANSGKSAGTSAARSSRGPETIIDAATTINADGVTMDGLTYINNYLLGGQQGHIQVYAQDFKVFNTIFNAKANAPNYNDPGFNTIGIVTGFGSNISGFTVQDSYFVRSRTGIFLNPGIVSSSNPIVLANNELGSRTGANFDTAWSALYANITGNVSESTTVDSLTFNPVTAVNFGAIPNPATINIHNNKFASTYASIQLQGIAAGANVDFMGNTFSDITASAALRINPLVGANVSFNNNTFVSSLYLVNYGPGSLDLASNPNFADIGSGKFALATATNTELFAVADRNVDAVDRSASGYVILKTGHVYVTPNSFASSTPFSAYFGAPYTTTPSLQRAINSSSSGDIINIQSGSYPDSSLSITQNNLTLLGASGGGSTTGASLTATGTGTLTINDLAFGGGTITNYNTVNLGSSSSTAGNYTINGNSFSRAVDQATGSVTFTSVTNVGVTGGSGNDTFNITGSATGPIYSINGGTGTNSIVFDAGGASVTVTGTQILATGKQPVNYSNATVTIINTSTINGTSGNDILQLKASGTDLQFNLNSGGWVTITAPTSFTFNGGDGNDELIIHYGSGLITQPVFYNGDNPTSGTGDKLTITGGSFALGTFTYTGVDSGTIALTGVGLVTFAGLEPVDTTGSTITDLVFNFPTGPSAATLANDGSNLKLSSASFEDTTFANPSGSITINRGNAADTLTLGSSISNLTATTIIGTSIAPFSGVSFTGALNLATGKDLTVFTTKVEVSAPISANKILLDADTGSQVSGSFIGALISANITAAGALTIEGRGGNAGPNQYGVIIFSAATLKGLSTTISGIGGASLSNTNHGVFVSGPVTTVTSTGGNVTVTGTGGGSGSSASASNYGVVIGSAGNISAGGSGNVAVTGQGGVGTGNFHLGVYLIGSGTQITSSGGNVTVTGTGGGSGSSATNFGVFLNSSSNITSGGSGSVTVQGTGGTGGAAQVGVYIFDGAQITSGGAGAVQVTGQGGAGGGSDNYGILISSSTAGITSGGGPITVQGTGGASASNLNIGVYLSSATISGSNTVQVTGVGGGTAASTGSSSHGLYFLNGTIVGTGSGNVTVQGTGGLGSGGAHRGVFLDSNSGIVTSLSTTGSIQVTGTGGTSSGSFNFGIQVRNSAQIATGASSSGQVQVTGTGGGDGSSASGNNYGVLVESAGKILAGGSGNVAVTGQGGVGTGNFHLGVYVTGSSSQITSSGGKVDVKGTGGGVLFSSSNYGVLVGNTATIAAGGSGLVTVTGIGGHTSGNFNNGVYVLGANSKITSGGGNVEVTGTGKGTGGFSYGTVVESSAQITAGGSGNVKVVGTGSTLAVGDFNQGVALFNNAGILTSAGGKVEVIGTGGGASSSTSGYNRGIVLESGSTIRATGANVAVDGTGGTGGSGNFNHGILLLSGSNINTLTSGNLVITATGGGTSPSTVNDGLWVDPGTTIVSAGQLTVTGNKGVNSLHGVRSIGATFSSFGNASLSSTNGSNIEVTPGSTGFGGTLTINTGGDAKVISNSTPITLAGSNSIGGNLFLQANGNITQTGGSSLSVTGTSTLSATSSGNNITLDGNNNFVGAVTIPSSQANNVELNDTAGGLIIAGTNLPGIMRLTTVGGLTQTAGGLSLGGLGVRNSGSGNIDLDDFTNFFNTSPGKGFAALNTAPGGSVTLKTGGATHIGPIAAGTSFVATSGITTSNGLISVDAPSVGLESNLSSSGGAITFSTGSGDVLLANVNITSGGGNITIPRNIDADAAANNRELMINGGSGDVDLLNVGTTQPVHKFTLTSGSGSTLGAVFARDLGVTINSTNITLNGSIIANSGSSGAPISITGGVTLGNDLDIASTLISGSVTFVTGTTIDGAKNLQVFASTGGIALNNTAIGQFTPLNNLTLSSMHVNGSGGIKTNTSLTVNTGSASNTLSGVISGTGTFVKNGSGTLTLTAANTYSGATTINAGTLLVNGSITSDVTVNSGGTLGGSGTITKTVTINVGGKMAPGNSPGILYTGDYTQSGDLEIEIVNPFSPAIAGTHYDQVDVTGTVTLNSGATLTLTFLGSGTIPDGTLYTIINNDGTDAVTGTFSGKPNGSTFTANGQSWVIFYNGGTGNDVTLTTVPALTPTVVYVSPTWGSLTPGSPIADADFGAAGSQLAIFGFNAFTTIAAALAAVTSSGTIIVNGGTYAETITLSGTQTLEITGPDTPQAVTISALTTAAGQNVIIEGSSTLTVGDATSTIIAGVISGSGSLIKQGSGTLTLTAANTYTGGTTISQGTLIGTTNTAFGSGSITLADANTLTNPVALRIPAGVSVSNPITVSASGTGLVTIGTTSSTGLPAIYSGVVTLNRATTFESLVSDRLAFTNKITGPVGTLTITGSNRTTVESTANDFTGNINIVGSGTILQASVASAGEVIPDTAIVDVGSGATFQLAGTAGSTETIAALTGSGGTISRNVSGTQTLRLNTAGTSSYSGAINNGSGVVALTMQGTGTQTIAGTGSTSNTASGLLTVSSGTLIMGAGFTGDGAWKGDVNIASGATLKLAQTNIFANGSDFTVNGTFNMNGLTDVIGNLSGSGSIIGNTSTFGLVLDDISGTKTFTGSISGGGGFGLRGSVANSGVQELGGTSTYTLGTVTVGQATLTITNTPTISISGTLNVGDRNVYSLGSVTATLNILSGSITANQIDLGNTSTSNTAKGTINQSGGSVITTNSSPPDNSSLRIGHWPNGTGFYNLSGGSLTVSKRLATAIDGTGTFTQTGGTASAQGVVVNARAGSGGNGTFTLNAGTFTVDSLGIVNDDTGPATLNLGGGTLKASASFSQAVPANLTNSSGPAIFDTNGFTITVTQPMSGVGGVIKQGSGTLTLTAANTYSGTTTVNAGTLLVNGTNSGSGAVNVNSGGLLGGTGSIAGGVTVNTGGSITGGTLGGVGTLTVGSLTLNGGTFQADFLNNTSDTITTAGTVNVNAGTAGVFNVNSQSGTTSAANVFTLINNTGTGAITNTPLTGAPEAGTATINGKTGYFSYVGGDGNNFTLTIAGPPVLSGAGNLEVRQIISSGKEVIQLLQGTSIIDSRPLDSIVGVYTVNGSAGDDTLTINYSTVAPATGYFQRDITFNAGAGDDTMHIVSGTFGTTVYNYTNANDGNVQNYQLPGIVTLLNTITYTGLTPLTNSGTVADIIFNLPAAASNAFLQDSGTQLKLFSSPATFENTTFTPATNSTTINRGNAADQLTIGTVTNLVNTLTVGSSGNNFAEITQNGAISLVAGKTLTYWADQINLGNNITTTGGNINLNGTTKTVLTNSVVIDSANGAATGGNVLFNTPNVFTNGTGKDLTITTASTTGGNVTFTGLIEGVASDRSDLINDLLINTKSTTGADGTINFTSTGGVSIFVQSTASDQGSITLQGDVRLSSVATFDSGNNQPGSISSGTIDLSQSQISGTVAGVNLQLFSNTYGGGTGPSGDISLGHFGNAGGHKLVVAEAFAQKNTGSAAGNVSINLGRTSNTTPTSAGEVTGNFLAWGGIITSNTNLTADTFAIVASTKIVDGNGSAVNFTGNKLQLRSAGAGQPIDLQTDVNVIAAKAAGDITLTNSKFLTIDKLTYTATDLPPSSFTTNGIEALGQTVDLTAPGITQTTDGVIKSAHLRLQGTGNFTLDKSNEVSTFAANVTGNLSLKTITALTIGTVLGTDGVTVNGGNFNLVVDGTGNDLAINKAVSVPTGSITMDVYGSINSNSSGSITGKNNVSLTFGQNGSDNTFNAAITSANDAVSLTGVAGVTKITTNAAVTAGAGQLLSVTTPAGNDQLTFNSTLTGGSIQVQTNAGDDSITFNGNVTAGAGTITISSGANDDTITVNATISATGTALIDGGTGTDVVTILGTGGNDTFDINKTFAKTALVRGGKFEYANVEVMNLNTGAGKDIFEIGFGTYAGAAGFLPATVNILAGADDDAATIYMPAGHNNTAGTWAKINWLDSSAAVRGGETVTYTPALEQLTIQGNTGRDWFFARPSTTAKVTKITINGDLPTSATPPGDRLQLDVSGLTAGIDTTHAKIPNGKLTGTAISQINWTGIESLPVPLGLGGSFDLGRTISPAPGHHSPIQETGTGINADPLPSPNNEAVSWLGVDASETFAGNGNIYGWDVATQSFVRYTNDPIHNQSLPPGPNRDLLQDGHYWPSGLANKRNFQVAVAPGGEVWVTVFVGDQAPLGGTKGEVWIEGTKYDSFNVPNGKFYTGRFLVADAGGDGVLNISIYQPMLDSWSLLNGIDVRPSDWVAPITLTRQDGDPNPVAADGFTIDKYNFTNAQPNQVFTVTATLGKLVNGDGTPLTDVDPSLNGLQIQANALGQGFFHLMRPGTGSNSSFLNLVSAYGDAALNVGGIFQPFQQQYFSSSTPTPSAPSFKFDFDSAITKVTQTDYTPVYFNTLYGGMNAFGWASNSSNFDRTNASTPFNGTTKSLNRDGHMQSVSNTFTVNTGTPNKTYSVTVYLGEPAAVARRGMTVSVSTGTMIGGTPTFVSGSSPTAFVLNPALPYTPAVGSGTAYFTATQTYVVSPTVGGTVGLTFQATTNSAGLLGLTFGLYSGVSGWWNLQGIEMTPVSPLVPMGGPSLGSAERLSNGPALQSIIGEAISRWAGAGLSAAQLAKLQSVRVEVANLPGGELGVHSPGRITLDDDGAGRGWFVDPTPSMDEEFGGGFSVATGRYDLLSVIMHELGHELGLTDRPRAGAPAVMTENLGLGERRSPTSAEVSELVELRVAEEEFVPLTVVKPGKVHGPAPAPGFNFVTGLPDEELSLLGVKVR